ncbi:HAMP domain-containing protein [Synergistaceae bacterium OttesenSCG-928-I11]|nr:HAMP domain-containing protein [Synergistaceae bacterium OttesenSCG-928-I11]
MKARRFLKMLRPDSLFGQLLLVTIVGAVLLQCVNFFAVHSIQKSYAKEFLSIGHDYVISMYHTIRYTDREGRLRLVEDIARTRGLLEKPFRVRILTERPEWETQDYYKAAGVRKALQTAMRANDIDRAEIRSRVLDETSPEASDPHYGGYLFPLLQVVIRMDDDIWLELVQPMILTDLNLIRRQRELILVGTLVISFATIFLIRRATKPLHKLRQAAEAFGRCPESAVPLEESGSIEVREAAQSFNRMRKRICDNMSERNSMLEAMGHDLRTPLARIQLRLDKIKPDELREKFRANIDEIQSIVEQGVELAQSLHSSEAFSPLDVTAFVWTLVDDMEAQGENVVSGDMPPDDEAPLVVMARPTSLKRCVENLLTNAVKYAGNARISVSSDDAFVTIDVDDDGPGIPAEMLEKVFEPYCRLEYSRNRGSGGTGLGLSIAYNMALLNNGTIRLSNRPEGGLRARVAIPRADARGRKYD